MGINKQQGFSIIETVLASAVLSVGLLGFIGMFGAGYKALDSGHAQTVATKLARDQLERLRATPPAPISPREATLSNGMKQTWSVLKDPKDPNIWIISVRVTWKNMQGQLQEIDIQSFRAS